MNGEHVKDERCDDYPLRTCAAAAQQENVDLPVEQWCPTCRAKLEQPTLGLMTGRSADK